ncbi:MAG TPA: GlxA family transcriptional regulator [Pseudomonas xinjiangensis]|uniref:GlxA family transcriptional regulator n=2 Tax=root TaxID=1 RepID=A0A7V1BPN1_9GAMM|nr:GlxA family transcriptional regulator [Halopseudomonas xinjiangensis]HEC48657.1 GlxA family transcriptional regulator [Halopseudomonas xinjiangensis]
MNHLQLPGTPLREVVILATDGVVGSTLMQAKDFFFMASLRDGRQRGLGLTPAFRTSIIAVDSDPVISFSQDRMPVDASLEAMHPQLILLPAFWGDFDQMLERYPSVVPWLKAEYERGTIISAEATGVFWVAAAGLLDGKEATTYWRFFDEFSRRFPRVVLNREKHITDADRIICAAGVTSACDMYIHLIEHFCGSQVAQAVARDTLYEIQRSYTPGVLGFGGQKLHQDVAILQIQGWLEEHFSEKFRFEDVASQHGMSIRNFMRRFQSATGDKPLHYLQRLRIETAKSLLSTTKRSIKTISYDIGYDDASFFARLFRQHTDLSPNQYRRQFLQKPF